MTNKLMKRYLISLVFIEMQIKATMKYIYTHIEMTKTILCTGKDMKELELSYSASKNVKWNPWKTVWQFLKS